MCCSILASRPAPAMARSVTSAERRRAIVCDSQRPPCSQRPPSPGRGLRGELEGGRSSGRLADRPLIDLRRAGRAPPEWPPDIRPAGQGQAWLAMQADLARLSTNIIVIALDSPHYIQSDLRSPDLVIRAVRAVEKAPIGHPSPPAAPSRPARGGAHPPCRPACSSRKLVSGRPRRRRSSIELGRRGRRRLRPPPPDLSPRCLHLPDRPALAWSSSVPFRRPAASQRRLRLANARSAPLIAATPSKSSPAAEAFVELAAEETHPLGCINGDRGCGGRSVRRVEKEPAVGRRP